MGLESRAVRTHSLELGIRLGALRGEFLRILSHASFRSSVTAAPVSSRNVRSTSLIRPNSLYPPTGETGHRSILLERAAVAGSFGDRLSTPKGRSFPAALPLVRLKKQLPDNSGQCALAANSSSKLPVASAEWVVTSTVVWCSHDPYPVGRAASLELQCAP